MSLLKDLGFDEAAGVSIADAEKAVASGGLPPEGVHHAVLDGCEPPNDKRNGYRLTFKIVAGPGEGATVEDVVWRPKGDDEKKDKTVRNRSLIFAHRLGVVKKDDKGHVQKIEGRHGFEDVLGAPCFIEVKHEEEDWEKDGKKRVIKKARLTFEGVLAPDDKKVKGVAVAKTLPAVGAAAGGAAGAKKDDFSDL